MKFLFDLGGVFFDWDPHHFYKNVFDDEERKFIEANSKNFLNIKLGSQILKADTAVIAALSLTFHFFQRKHHF